jgi:hypothetical protein
MTTPKVLASVAATAVALTAATLVLPPAASAAAPAGIPGVELLTSRPSAAPVSVQVAKALAAAQAAAEREPGVLAPPYVDSSGQLVVAGVGTAGAAAAKRAVTPSGLRAQLRTAPRSLRTLRTVQDTVIDLTTRELPGSSGVYASYIDAPRNRVIVETTSASPALLRGLKSRYGSGTVAVVAIKGAQKPTLNARNSDTAPFWGGSTIWMSDQVTGANAGGCSTAFAWAGTSEGRVMATAGHCTGRRDINFRTPVAQMGYSFGSVDSTWHSVEGTVAIKRRPHMLLGDVGIVRLEGRGNAGRVFSGGPGATSDSKRVLGMWGAPHAVGGQYCSSGSTTGETCGWTVTAVQANVKYSDGATARNVSTGSKMGACMLGGDSGGAIYVDDPARGGVHAYGIHSGGDGDGDSFRTPGEAPCFQVMTDIENFRMIYGPDIVTG